MDIFLNIRMFLSFSAGTNRLVFIDINGSQICVLSVELYNESEQLHKIYLSRYSGSS